jgi:hypothetical protein
MLLGPGTTLSASAAGRDEVFVMRADRTLWQDDLTGLAEISSGSFGSISGPRNVAGQGEAFGVLTDGELWEYNLSFAVPGHWQELDGGVLGASAPGRS